MKRIVLLMVSATLMCWTMRASADIWYVATNSVQNGPGTTWSNAFRTIQGGVESAEIGDTVWVTNGLYEAGSIASPLPGRVCSSRVAITNSILVCSVNGPDVTIIKGAEASGGGNGSSAVRCIFMSAGVLSGFTLTNGYTAAYDNYADYDDVSGGGAFLSPYGEGKSYGTLTNCVLTGNSSQEYGGGSCEGMLNNCTLIGNSSLDGGGSSASFLNNCMLIGNLAMSNGGGSHYGTLNNCVIADNSAELGGGGSYYGTLNNCTITGNSTFGEGGGSLGGTLKNCILYFNTSAKARDNWSDSYDPISIAYSCTTPMPPNGTGNITNNPILLSTSHISYNSPCTGAGSATGTIGNDIDGEGWAAPPSMGCDEPSLPITGDLEVSITTEYSAVVKGHELYFSADIEGKPANTLWSFGDSTQTMDSHFTQHAWDAAGDYPVVLTAYNDDHPSGISASVTIEVLDSNDFFVNASNTLPAAPYTDWATAATNIQDAVDYAQGSGVAGSTVRVTNGVYDVGSTVTPAHSCQNRVVINKDIIVRSVAGPSVTIIKGTKGTGGNNDDAVRCVYMSAGLLADFTITNGDTMTHNSSGVSREFDASGGGVNMYAGNGVVSNCILSGNSGYEGGGSYCGTLNNCTLTNNTASSGGGSSGGTLNNCTLSNNSAGYGGGIYDGTLNYCTLAANKATFGHGGGSYGGTLNHCILTGNTAWINGWAHGGGSFAGTLNNCTLMGNSADHGGGSAGEEHHPGTLNNCKLTQNSALISGGGSYYLTLNNCAISDNTALHNGGGSAYSTMINCTLANNTAGYSGGGSFEDALTNCIVFFNTAGKPLTENWESSTLSYSCTTPMPGGPGNITDYPILQGSSHIHGTSPCVANGLTSASLGNDIDGDTWSAPPSMGCDEPLAPFSGELEVFIAAGETNVIVGYELLFAAEVKGEVEATRWEFGDGDIEENITFDVPHAWSSAGVYPVVLTAWNEDNPGGVSATVMVHVVTENEHYVDINNTLPSTPYTSWATAATNIQDAVDVAAAGALVRVAGGEYATGSKVTPGHASYNRVVITKDILLRSEDGPESTIIQGSEASGGGNGTDAVRGIYMSAGVLQGFTVTNGHTMTTLNEVYDNSGGGVNMTSGNGELRECILSGNSAYLYGGGSSYGTLTDCTLIGNDAFHGGGIAFGVLNYCTLTNNHVYGIYSDGTGGGSYLSTLTICTLSGNSATLHGGGSYGGTLDTCTLTGNEGGAGGGSYAGTLSDCTITGNSADNGGGSAAEDFYNPGILTNCTISGNTALEDGGGAYGCTLSLCTLTYNTATNGGGAAGSELNNCMVTYNTALAGGGGGSYCDLNNCTISGNTALHGGGTYSGVPNNCLITGNHATENGGGSYFAGDQWWNTMNNCTISGNTAAGSGGGCHYAGDEYAYNNPLSNCIIYSNTATVSSNNWSGDITCSYTCTTPLPPGTDNIDNNPQFIDAAVTNLRLTASSPCINSGNNTAAKGNTDLEGSPRIVNLVVDMGAYEYIHSADNYDGDAFSNDDEQIADTDPADSSDWFHITAFSNGPSATVYFDSSAERIYTLLWSTNLIKDVWSNLPGNPPQWGVGGADYIDASKGAPTGFYKLTVEMP